MSNIKPHIIGWFALLLVLLGGIGMPAEVQAQPYSGDAEFEHREFDEEALEEYRNNPDYQYRRNTGSELNPIERFWEWIKNWFGDYELEPQTTNVSAPTGLAIFGQALLWVMIIAIAGFLLFQILNIDIKKLVRKKSDTGNIDYDEKNPESLDQINFDELIREAIEKGLYRTAIRLHYLRSLRNLQDKNLIKWRPEKTNFEYTQEIRPGPMRKVFTDLTRLFEYIWYGEFDLDKAHFSDARESFARFDKQVKEGNNEN